MSRIDLAALCALCFVFAILLGITWNYYRIAEGDRALVELLKTID